MKKVLSVLLSLCLFLGILPLSTSAEEENYPDGFDISTYVDASTGLETVELWRYRGPGGKVVIPDGVTMIGSMVFHERTDITGIAFPASIKVLGMETFAGCYNITDWTIPESIRDIVMPAVHGSKFLLGNSNDDIYLEQYLGDGGEVVIPEGITKLWGSDKVFQNRADITSVTFPSTIREVNLSSFEGCTGITDWNYPDSVRDIVMPAIHGKDFIVKYHVTNLGDRYDVEYVGKGGDIVLPETITCIDKFICKKPESITGITFPRDLKEVTRYGAEGFHNLPSLIQVEFSDKMEKVLPENMFLGCHKLTKSVIPDAVRDLVAPTVEEKDYLIGRQRNANGSHQDIIQAYQGSENNLVIPSCIGGIGKNAFKGNTALTSVVIPSSVTQIGSGAFEGCTSLTSVHLEGNPESISYDAFAGCTALTEIDAKTDRIKANAMGYQLDDDGIGYRSARVGSLKKVQVPKGIRILGGSFDDSDVEEVIFPDTLLSLEGNPFNVYHCPNLKSVTIPASVTVIPDNAISGGEEEYSVAIHGAAGSAAEAFAIKQGLPFVADQEWNASGDAAKHKFTIDEHHILRKYEGPGGELTVPSDVKEISVGAFTGHGAIKSITVPDGVKTICISNDSVEKIVIGNNAKLVQINGKKLDTLKIGDSAQSINIKTEQMKSLTIGKVNAATVTITTSSAEKISIGDGAQSIDITTGKLENLTIGSGVQTLKISADDIQTWNMPVGPSELTIKSPNLQSLDMVNNLKGVTKLSLNAKKLQTLSLAEGITNLQLQCPSLKQLTVPKSVKSGKNIFEHGREKVIFAEGSTLYRGTQYPAFADFLQNSKCYTLEEIVNCPNHLLDYHVAAARATRENWDVSSPVPKQSERITKLSNEITAGCSTETEKVKAISKWVILNVDYDYDYYYVGLKDYSDVPYDPEDILDKRIAVCAGYARLTQALLNAQGIPCLYVHGMAGGGKEWGRHAWNLAYADGKYMWLDNTWGMTYCGRGEACFSLNHIVTSGALFNVAAGPGSIVQPKLDKHIQDELDKEMSNVSGNVPKPPVEDDPSQTPDPTSAPSPVPTATPAPKPGVPVFSDVPKGQYYYRPVLWAVEKGITGGTSATTFSPSLTCTRAQIMTFLWASNGKPSGAKEAAFSDMPSNSTFKNAINWAVENEITGGIGNNRFGPDNPCTRVQAVTFLWVAAGRPAPSKEASFSDMPSNPTFRSAISWAVENKITSGVGNNQFGTNKPCTRGQIITFLYAAQGK